MTVSCGLIHSNMPQAQGAAWKMGPAIDIGHVMIAKILKDNGQVLYRSTFRTLKFENWEHKRLRDAFDTSMIEKIGKPTKTEDLADLDPDAVISEYEVYNEGTGYIPDADADTAHLIVLTTMQVLKSISHWLHYVIWESENESKGFTLRSSEHANNNPIFATRQ